MNILDQAQAVIEKSFVRKANMSTSDLTTGGGLLAPQQSAKFIRLLQFPPTLLRVVRLVPMKGRTDRIDRIYFPDRIMHTASENTALTSGNRSVPTTSKVSMSAKLFKAEIRISYETLQDSIEGGKKMRGNSFENMLFNLIASGAARDIEEFALLSDQTSTDSDLATFDGWITLASASHTYDNSGAALSKAFFKNVFLQLPKQYRRNKRDLLWTISSNMEVEWADELADAYYTEFAQKVAWGDTDALVAYGVPMLVSQHMPAESGTSSNLGKVLISHPKNMILGIWRDITMEVDRDVSAGTLIVVVSVRIDARFEQVEGAATGTNVKVA